MRRIEPSLCLMRILATVSVVFLHVCSTVTAHPDLYPLSEGELAFFLAGHYIMNWAVPLFLMITGALLLRREKVLSIRDVFAKYILRMVLVLLIFGLPLGMMAEWFETRRLSASLLTNGFIRMVTCSSFTHLWYIHMLIGIYLALPLLKAAVSAADDGTHRYIAAALFAVAFVLPTLGRLTGIMPALTMPMSWPVFYLLMGYLLYHGRMQIGRGVAAAGLALCAGVIIAVCVAGQARIDVVGDYYSPVIAVMAVSLFVLLKGIEIPERAWEIDRLCFGVYIIHPVFIQVLYRMARIAPVGPLYPLKAIGLTAVIAGLSFACCRVMRMLPFMARRVL